MKKLIFFLLLLCITTSASAQFFTPHQKPMLGLQVNGVHPLAPTVFWLYNEDSGGRVNDLSGNGKNISLTNTSWVSGEYGPAIEANANGEYGSFVNTSNSVISSEKCTLVFHFKSNVAFDDDAAHFLVGSRGAANDSGDLYIAKWTDNNFFILFNDGSNHYINFDSTHFPNWQTTGHQIVVQWDRSAAIWNSDNIVCAIDGIYHIPDGQSLETAWNALTFDTPIGVLNDVENTTDRYANGTLSYMYAYNRILSSSEIAQLYSNPFCFMQPSWNWVLYGGISVGTKTGQVIMIQMN